MRRNHRRGEGWDGVDCLPGEGWVGIAPDGVDCGILAGRGMGLGLRRIIGAARDGTGLTVESSPGEGWG